jgi:hypothetical protein
MCPRDRFIPKEDTAMRLLGNAKLHVYDRHTHGQFFWNFRTEFEPRWDFQEAVRRKWLPMNYNSYTALNGMLSGCGAEQADHPLVPAKPEPFNMFSHDNAVSVGIIAVAVIVLIAAVALRESAVLTRRMGYQTVADVPMVKKIELLPMNIQEAIESGAIVAYQRDETKEEQQVVNLSAFGRANAC